MNKIHPDILAFWQDEPDMRVTDAELSTLEAEVGTPLPEAFKRYHKEIGYKRTYFKNEKYKWGEVEAGITPTYEPGAGSTQGQVVFAYFYSMEGISNNRKEHASSLPPQMLTIGSALGKTSGQVLLDLSSNNLGKVWFWERSDEPWGKGGNDRLGLLGADLYDMLARLTPYEG